MKRFSALFKETWWLWIAICGTASVMAVLVSFIFWVAFPISAFSFIYFGMVRYDENGHLKQL